MLHVSRKQESRPPAATNCGSGRAMAPACRGERPLPLAATGCDGVARRRVRVFVNICSGIFGVLRGESARVPLRVNAFRTLRATKRGSRRVFSDSAVSECVRERVRAGGLLSLHGCQTGAVAVPSNARRRVVLRRLASRRANLAERVRDVTISPDPRRPVGRGAAGGEERIAASVTEPGVGGRDDDDLVTSLHPTTDQRSPAHECGPRPCIKICTGVAELRRATRLLTERERVSLFVARFHRGLVVVGGIVINIDRFVVP
ncbi:hypothetical protein DBV15_09904 [Temnothorax longispinosus]|uniref:Uncharacterized protein n=1 Tax=Temnothorax longispinosus TaxID=300112 RepID=A0A4S2KAH3_9HYME|nr:hypothetical protein DBV15_09904 [Temnothorax longispinosus]